MKVEFRFNGSPQVILMPETAKEVSLVKMAFLDTKEKPLIDFQASWDAVITITLCENQTLVKH